MSIKKYKTQKGDRYEFIEHIGVDPLTGKRILVHKRGFKSSKEARSKINELKYEFDHGLLKKSSSDTYKEVYERWLPLYAETVKESTLNKTMEAFQLHILPEVGNLRISKITPLLCQNLAENMSKAYKNYRKNYGYAVRVYDYALTIGLVSSPNPFKRIIYPKNDTSAKPTPYMEKEELIKLLECIKETGHADWYAFFRLMAYSGMRRGEILALTWGDVDFSQSTIRINKTLTSGLNNKQYVDTTKTSAGERTIIMDQGTMKILKEYRAMQKVIGILQLVFPNAKGQYMALSKPNEFLQRVIKKNGLKKVTNHGFRHTHCAMLFSAGVSIKAVQERLGHDDFKTTMDIYNHVMSSDRKEAVEKFSEYLEA